MTNKWFDISKQTPDPQGGLTKEGDKILVYGDGYALLYEVKDGVLSMNVPDNFTISHWQIARLPDTLGGP